MSQTPPRPVRVRFAPSPTGYLHIGNARAALFNWLFARKYKGVFILRVEDTDQKRYVADAEQDCQDSLRWLGLNWDEGPDVGGSYGPYRQSERSELYRQWAGWLLDNGYAYRCNCTPERLAELRAQQEKSGAKRGYDRHCRDLDLGDDIGPHVVRFKMPLDGETMVDDMIRGPIVYQNADLEDLVLLKSDGLPTYHLANVVDDHLMSISHILRGDDWIATAPLHVQLYKAFGWEMPPIAHLPMILSPSGKGKLSKRDQAFEESGVKILVQVREYRQAGYLPEAVINFLTNVGWAFGDDREIFTPEEAMARFEIEDINPAGSKLPFEKLIWLNNQYIQMTAPDALAEKIKPYLEAAGLVVDMDKLRAITPYIQERLKLLSEAPEWLAFLFKHEITINDPKQLLQKKMDAESTLKALKASYDTLKGLDDFSHEKQEETMRALAVQMGLSAGQLFGTVRVATSGQPVSPPLFQSMAVLGKDVSLKRIQDAIRMLEDMDD
ncbi:MAG: glutamate--tRNA ligase [Anaerolineae bacterium]|nr:glutamate--tRNA ligase [Anaerolineae bacterium]